MKVSIIRGGRRGIDLEIVRLRLSRRTHHRFARCNTLTPAHVCSAAMNGVGAPKPRSDFCPAKIAIHAPNSSRTISASDGSLCWSY